jgi:hypothetical protein
MASGLVLGTAEAANSHVWPRDQYEARHNSTLNATTPLRVCIDLRDGSCAGYKNLGSGTTVLMRCWWDGRNSAGSVIRFFWVDTVGNYNGQGFVTSNLVSNQWSAAPWCGNDQKIKAIQWAGRKYKEVYLNGWCLTFAWQAYAYGAAVDHGGHYSAKSYWQNYVTPLAGQPAIWDMSGYGGVVKGGKVATRTNYYPPLGAYAFWDYAPDGHVGISIGDGIVISTSRSAAGQNAVHLFRANAATSGYAGWVRF